MQRKLFRTSFLALLMLFSLLLSGCSGTKPPPRVRFVVSELPQSYDLNESYFITFEYGHRIHNLDKDFSDSNTFAILKCHSKSEDGTILAEDEALLEIKSYISYENFYKNRKTITVEMPKKHFTADKGSVSFYLYPGYGEELETVCGFVGLRYEKREGRIYFEVRKQTE